MTGLSILTQPFLKHSLKAVLINIRKKIIVSRTRWSELLINSGPRYGGHYAVTRSLVEGLTEIGYSFNYNPRFKRHVADKLLVLSDLDALRQAIQLKRRGIISYLAAGPNLVVLPSDNPKLICAPEIDTYMVNSQWTYDAYADDCPELKSRLAIWPAGVDIEFWRRDEGRRRSKILLYDKVHDHSLIKAYREMIERRGFQTTIVNFGKYQLEEFKEALQACVLAVFFSKSESQGIALAEAWSMDVPTLVWNPGIYSYKGRQMACSSAPYLTDETGSFFVDSAEFEPKFAKYLDDPRRYHPRDWIINNLTDEICAKKLLTLLGLE